MICNLKIIYFLIFFKKKRLYITYPLFLDTNIYVKIADAMYERDRVFHGKKSFIYTYIEYWREWIHSHVFLKGYQ